MKLFKKILCGILSVTMLITSAAIPVMAENDIKVMLDGNALSFDVPPQIINDRTMVPLRAIFEALGASVDWNQETRTVTSTKGDTTIKLTINSNTMYVNNNAVTLDTPACVVNDRTLVPVRAISEAYKTTVDWNGDTKTVSIVTGADTQPVTNGYDDISANVEQINNFINSGMYLEAMQECENTKKNHSISDADISMIDGLYNSAQAKYNEYNEQAKQTKLENFVKTAVSSYISSMKNPSSAQLHSVYAGYYERSKYNEDVKGSAIAVVIDIAGQNSFGGTTRNEATIILDEASNNMIVDLESYGKQKQKGAYGAGYISALNLQNEALYLQAYKTSVLQPFDVQSVLN